MLLGHEVIDLAKLHFPGSRIEFLLHLKSRLRSLFQKRFDGPNLPRYADVVVVKELLIFSFSRLSKTG